MEIRVDIIDVFHEPNLVPVPSKEGEKFFMVHAAENRALADLESVQVENRENSS